MATYLEIPLDAAKPQTLQVTLNGTNYNLRVWWNAPNQLWYIDFFDTQNNPILLGIPMTTGTDLLGQYEYLEFGGSLYALSDFDTAAPPTFVNLGSTGHLYFVVQ